MQAGSYPTAAGLSKPAPLAAQAPPHPQGAGRAGAAFAPFTDLPGPPDRRLRLQEPAKGPRAPETNSLQAKTKTHRGEKQEADAAGELRAVQPAAFEARDVGPGTGSLSLLWKLFVFPFHRRSTSVSSRRLAGHRMR
jgi:hypothetical protein